MEDMQNDTKPTPAETSAVPEKPAAAEPAAPNANPEPDTTPEEPQPEPKPEPEAPKPPQPPEEPIVISSEKRSRTLLWVLVAVAVLAFAAGAAYWWMQRSNSAQQAAKTSTAASTTKPTKNTAAPGTFDLAKNYGDKYSNGLLPVGDNKYVTDGAKKGYIYACNANFVPANQAGAQVRGPWFTNNNTQWDINKKVSVKGTVSWQPSMSVKVVNGQRIVTTNDLPDHHTGVFPVQSSDPAYQYDRNPSSISTQSLTYALTANPTPGDPQCMGGEVGVMLTGVALFDGFDAGGRDAGAWEVQDSCDGHPQNKGEYHYHTLSRCIADVSVKTVIGYALDGFPITGPTIAKGNVLTTDDLDECHGITSPVMLDGKEVTTYHYVMTQDFPYSVSCFRAKAIQPPGQHETTGSGTGGTGQQAGQQGQSPPPGGMPPR